MCLITVEIEVSWDVLLLNPIGIGLNTGILQVEFSHDVPEPTHTVTHCGYTHTRTVNHTVSKQNSWYNC